MFYLTIAQKQRPCPDNQEIFRVHNLKEYENALNKLKKWCKFRGKVVLLGSFNKSEWKVLDEFRINESDASGSPADLPPKTETTSYQIRRNG